MDTSSVSPYAVDKSRQRVVTYWISGIGLILVYILIKDISWKSNAQFHTVLETIATLLAMIVGIVALVRYYSFPSNKFLFIGAGFLGTAFLDAYHTIITSTWISIYTPSLPASLIPWSWVASRIFLGIMLYVGFRATLHEKKTGAAGLYKPQWVFLATGLFTFFCFFFFAVFPVSQAYWPELHHMHRPQEFIASLFFLLALWGYLREGEWRKHSFEHWLILALIVSLVGQTIFMPSSEELFDAEFDLAHMLKKISYIFVLTGLLFNMLFLYRQADLTEQLQYEVSERLLAEEKAKQANKQLVAVFEGVDDVIYVADPDTFKLLYVNPAFKKNWGDNVLGTICYKTLQNQDSPCPFCTNDKIFGEYLGQSYIWEFQNKVTGHWFRCADKAIKWIDGRMVRFELASDITEQKQAEEERAHYRENLEREVKLRTEELEIANKDLEGFSYSVSHDLRSPLRAINGFVSILQEDYASKLDKEGHRLLDIVSDNANKMGNLIDDILAFSRAGRLELECIRFNMNELVEEVWTNLESERKNGNYQFNCSELPNINADINALRQVWQNLLSNAIKFSRHRDPAIITITAEERENKICYSIADNGVGFNDEYKSKLFVLFQRLHGMDEFEGTGVGLAIIKRFLIMHGGDIEAHGVLDKGATFRFTLPKSRENPI